MWGGFDTRRQSLARLADKGFGREALAEMQRVIEAEHSDLSDVLGYFSFAAPPAPSTPMIDSQRARASSLTAV